MINKKIKVPNNKIAVIVDDIYNNMTFKRFEKIFTKPDKRREWFNVQAYQCHPMMVANQYGFVLTTEFDFNILWNGGDKKEDIQITHILDKKQEEVGSAFPLVASNLGNGVISFIFPFVLRTPPGVNLLTINPPNHVLENMTVLSGSVETDNLRMPFSVQIKLHRPNVLMSFKKGDPIIGFLPIPRFFLDSFDIVDASKIFDEKTMNEELTAFVDHQEARRLRMEHLADEELYNRDHKNYVRGLEIYGNKFYNHQGLKD